LIECLQYSIDINEYKITNLDTNRQKIEGTLLKQQKKLKSDKSIFDNLDNHFLSKMVEKFVNL